VAGPGGSGDQEDRVDRSSVFLDQLTDSVVHARSSSGLTVVQIAM
jgi:hypothetical protein